MAHVLGTEEEVEDHMQMEMEVQLGETIPTSGTELEVSTDPDGDEDTDIHESDDLDHEHEVKEIEHTSSSTQMTFPSRLNDVKVENWGNFCLGKINSLYEKEEYCDLTLKFTDGQVIRVHRVVLNVCTEYFANLEKIFGINDEGELVLPKDFDYNTVKTIIKFFYTGRMEVSQNVAEVYRAVRLMNITFLVKLLEAHGKNPTTSNKTDVNRSVMIKKKISPTHQIPVTRLNASNLSSGTILQKRITLSKSLSPGAIKTKTVLARVQPQQFRMQGGQVAKTILTPKKLPIWKDRKYIPAKTEPSPVLPPIKEEPARPTRFEWPDPEEDASNLYQTPINNYFDKSKFTKQTPLVDFEALKANTNAVKRSLDSGNEPPAKLIKLVSNDTKSEILDQDLEADNSEIDNSDAVTEPLPPPQTQMYPKTLITVSKSPNLHGIIKTPVSTSVTPKVGKSVRFADTPQSSVASATHIQESAPGASNTITVSGDNDGTHSKIIAELLKKFPNLVKDSKNIRLKIVPKSDSSAKEAKSGKVSYIVLKSSSSTDPTSGFVLKKGVGGVAKSKFWETEEDQKKQSAAVENITGPWICDACEESPIEFDSYYNFRKHLVDVHGEKIDVRICEYCGYKAGKRNLLLYHLYTKHSIIPPSHISFPHCESCDHVALSEPLLAKHRSTHDALKEFVCPVCNACFKTTGALQGHMAANLHRNQETKSYECPYCKKHFIRNINLKAHIRTLHKDIARLEEMEDHDEYESKVNSNKVVGITPETYVPSSSTILHGISNHGDTHQAQIGYLNSDGTVEIVQHCDQLGVPMSVLQSSEAEALNNVASSIATSLSLQQVQHVEQEYVEGDGSSQEVYLVDNAQAVNLSELNIGTDNTVLLTAAGGTECDQGQLIVQDIHGNRFQQVTGTDENGKSVIFFQLQSQGHQPIDPEVNSDGVSTQEVALIGEGDGANFHYGTSEEGRTTFSVQNDHMYLDPQKCSVFDSSGGAVPVENNSVIMASSGTETQIINMIPVTSAEQITHHLPQNILESEEQGQEEAELQHEEDVELVSEDAPAQQDTDTELLPDNSQPLTSVDTQHNTDLSDESKDNDQDTQLIEEGKQDDIVLNSEENHQTNELASDISEPGNEVVSDTVVSHDEIPPKENEGQNELVSSNIDKEPSHAGDEELFRKQSQQEIKMEVEEAEIRGSSEELHPEEPVDLAETDTPVADSNEEDTDTQLIPDDTQQMITDEAQHNTELSHESNDNEQDTELIMETDESPSENRLLVVENEGSNPEEEN